MLESGAKVGDTRIISQLAVDHMATIYLCERHRRGRFPQTVAAKLIHRHHTEDPAHLAQLMDEAVRSIGLVHDNIVQTLDVVELDGQVFIVMEHVDGPSLVNLVLHAERRGAQHQGNVAWLLAGVARGLHHAHSGGRGGAVDTPLLVHGDVGLDNVLVSGAGVPKLLDFDVARAKGRLQAPDPRRGRIEYTPPEALVPDAKVDHRIDVYGLGVCLYRATTGVFPFTGDSPDEVLTARRHHAPRAPSSFLTDYPAQLEQLVLWALKRDPDHRPRSAQELAEGLEAFCRSARGAASQHTVAVWMHELYPRGADPWTGSDVPFTRPLAPPRILSPSSLQPDRVLTPILTATGLGLLAVLVMLLLLFNAVDTRLGAQHGDAEITRLLDQADSLILQMDLDGARSKVHLARIMVPADLDVATRLADAEKKVDRKLRLQDGRRMARAGKLAEARHVAHTLVDADPTDDEALALLSEISQLRDPPGTARHAGEPGRLSVIGTEGAILFVDDVAVGPIPLWGLQLAPGQFRLDIRKAGHLPISRSVSIAEGEGVTVELRPLRRRPPPASEIEAAVPAPDAPTPSEVTAASIDGPPVAAPEAAVPAATEAAEAPDIEDVR